MCVKCLPSLHVLAMGFSTALGRCRRTEMIGSFRRLFFENSNRLVPKLPMENQYAHGSGCELRYSRWV
jgi:hypothetical protein